MKTIILSSFLILTTLIIEAQNDVFPMGDLNPEWRVLFSQLYPSGIEPEINIWLGGAVVDSCGESWTNISFETANSTIGESNYYYSTQGEQVYLRTGLDCSERKRLIYDFSLELGDSVSIYSPYMISNAEDSITYHVLGVSYRCYGGILRKYMFVQYEMGDPFDNSEFYTVYRTAWIEGIGDFIHPFPAIGGVCVYEGFCETRFRLNCLNTTEGTVYSRDSTAACEYDLSFLTRIHVDIDNTVYRPDGSKWSQAFSSLQDAIAIADYGDSIWVAEGTYVPTVTDNRNVYFELQNGIKIFGGFNATEQHLEERDWDLYPTILSGEIGDTNIVDDNSFHVVYTIGSDSTTWLDGFTIRDGNAFGSGLDRQGGGALVETDAENPITEPIFKNCLFTKNSSQFYGGAVSCFGPDGWFSVPSFDHCRFIENTSFFGSAVYKSGNALINKPQRFDNCLFEDNYGTDGAAVFFENVCNGFVFDYCTFNRDSSLVGSGGIQLRAGGEQTTLTIDHSVFSNNKGSFGGGLSFSGIVGGSATIQINIQNTHFIENTARNADGGAILFSFLRDTTDINIINSLFQDNTASEHGGAISIINERKAATFLTVDQSQFINNVSGSPGGGAINMFTFPDFSLTSFFKGKITNSLFTGNTGLWNMGPGEEGRVELEMLNCTSYDNGRFILSKTWGAEFDTGYRTAIATIENSIFWEPELDLQHIFYNGNADSFHVKGYTLRNNLISAASCDLEACDLADLGGNIYGIDPLFIDEAAGDLHLRACSPAINRGYNPSVVMANSMEDLDENIRIQEDTVDMGAYETLSFSLDVLATIIHSSGEGELDGIIDVDNISGGMPPYHLEWNTGDTTASIEGLSTGFYELTITDNQDCQQVFSYFVDVMVNAVEQLGREQFNLFPNPLQQGEVLRLFSNKEIATIEIWDSLGELIWAGSYAEFLNLGYKKCALGLNIIRVWFKNGRWGRCPFLVVD